MTGVVRKCLFINFTYYYLLFYYLVYCVSLFYYLVFYVSIILLLSLLRFQIILLLSLLRFLRFYDSTNEGELDYRSCCALKRVSIKSQRYVIKTIANQNRAVNFQIFFVFYRFLPN